MKVSKISDEEKAVFAAATASRIPAPVKRAGRARADSTGMVAMQPAPSPPGRVLLGRSKSHWSTTFVDVINAHVWRREALDAFVSHSFMGRPGQSRWCTRCTYMLAADWLDPKKPVPLPCGDPRIVPRPAMYEYIDGHPGNGIRLADPNYSGARVKKG